MILNLKHFSTCLVIQKNNFLQALSKKKFIKNFFLTIFSMSKVPIFFWLNRKLRILESGVKIHHNFTTHILW